MAQEPTQNFPTVSWGRTQAAFRADPNLPDAPIAAALVFATLEGDYLVGDIIGRGWCIPGGRLEPGETPEEALHREAYEEVGAVLDAPQRFGYYLLTDAETNATVAALTYFAEVTELTELPPGTESRGRRRLRFEELPEGYFLWDALIAAVFHYVQARFVQARPTASEYA